MNLVPCQTFAVTRERVHRTDEHALPVLGPIESDHSAPSSCVQSVWTKTGSIIARGAIEHDQQSHNRGDVSRRSFRRIEGRALSAVRQVICEPARRV